jgi:hypothetical protein
MALAVPIEKIKESWALAPEVCFFCLLSENGTFTAACLTPTKFVPQISLCIRAWL